MVVVGRRFKEFVLISTDKLQLAGIELSTLAGLQAIRYLPVLCKGYRFKCFVTLISSK
jgi:hypothetical protein